MLLLSSATGLAYSAMRAIYARERLIGSKKRSSDLLKLQRNKLPFVCVTAMIGDKLLFVPDVGDSVFCKACKRQNVVYPLLNFQPQL